jgi:CheY-like chemotaxis protein
MNHKVLLADDSLTIQKVIKITLANQPYDIVDCSSDDELFSKLSEVKPELVFLDFNLSEKYTGYELTSKIKAAVPSAHVLLLLGTFDTVDDAAMEKCGAADKIVKPFDSNKFIAICKRLLDTQPIVEEINFPEPQADHPEVKEDDQWTMNHSVEPIIQAQEPTGSFDVRTLLNPLDQEISEWGMSVPGVINDKQSHEKTIDLPPVIGEVKSLEAHRNKLDLQPEIKSAPVMDGHADIKFPETDDLDYPTIEDLQDKKSAEEKAKPSSKLLSIDSFNQRSIEFEIEHTINSVEETDISSLEAQIRDEVEEDLWQVDEFEELKNEVSTKIEEVKNNFRPSEKDFDESLFKPLDENETIPWISPSAEDLEFPTMDEPKKEAHPATVSPQQTVVAQPDMQALRAEIEELVKKHVKEYIDQMFQQKIEKVTWEVVPDLAENLIRQELSKITNKILNDSN